LTYYRPPRTAGNIVPFRPKPGVPTLGIGSRKYVLSTDGGPLGDREDDDYMEDSPFGARIIRPDPTANKWRYLWAYNTDHQTLTMWRVSDGNEKVHDSARSQQARIFSLEKRGQLNRVTQEEFRQIEAEMDRRMAAQMRAMKDYLDASKDEAAREIDQLVQDFYGRHVLPKLQRGLSDVRRGVIPLGFQPFGPALDGDPDWLLRQMSSYVLGQVFRREMDIDKVEAFLKTRSFDLNRVDPQTVQWAIDEVRDNAVDELLPDRPPAH